MNTFEAGDRVKISPFRFMLAGMTGKVIGPSDGIENSYVVELDGEEIVGDGRYHIREHDLEKMED